ncbi:THAP domain-containing protein 6-like [Myzus persicae]|uniref:THAP domain-containing protein 6-like n=1 Tax=Myzus persicae TaxID=13164 RepID=UPI000B935910|nr:THAP domain-containing protein 6-like [Myzus persicae]
MPSNKCCVLGCESGNSVKKHVFPTEDNDFATWVSRTGNVKLEALSKSDVRKTYLICTKHFNSSNYSCGTFRLKKGSLPTVSLPSINSPKTPLDGPEHPFLNESIEFVDVSSSSPLDLPINDSPLGKN